jgi:D-alanyl-D-alanine carboxypeptidase (penicillin-binding protein 5/6)
MIKYSFTPLLLASLLLCSFITGLSATPATAVPVLQETNKQVKGLSSSSHGASEAMTSLPVADVRKKSAAIKPGPGEIKILGTYNDTSPHKKKVGSTRPADTVLTAQKGSATKARTNQYSTTGSSRIQKKISAKSAMVMDASTGRTIFSVAPDTPRQPASTIKILTGMIAIKSLDSNESIPVSAKAAEQPRSKVYLERKKHYKADDLINAVLLSSANDASVAIAEKIAGSEQSFARMMTLRAKLWGAQNTVCKTANGLTATGQTSTARDLATIFRHAMQDKEFSQRIKQLNAQTAEGKVLRNHNKALWQIEGALGGKTGFTNAAGQTYVGKFKRGSDEIIVSIMGSGTMWADLKTLVEHGFSQQALMASESTENMKNSKVVASIPKISSQQ